MRRAQSRKTKPQGGSRRWWYAAALVLIATAGYIAWRQYPAAPPQPALPQEPLAVLEPDVRQLVAQHVARVEDRPTSAVRHAELGLVYEANELWPAARDAFAVAVELAPDEPLFRLHHATAVLQSGDSASYQQLLENLVEDVPGLVAAQQRWGQSCLEAGKLTEAEKAFREVIRRRPQAAEGYVGLADVMLQQDQAQQAVKLLERAVKLDANYRVAQFLLGNAYRKLGRMEEAAGRLKQGQAAKVRYLSDQLSDRANRYAVTVRGRHTRALKHLMAGEFPEATELLEAALRSDSENVPILNALAGTYMQTGKSDAAFELLQQAKRLDDKDSTTYINLASWYLYHGKLDEALRFAEGAVERGNRVASAHRVRLEVLLRAGQIEAARAAAREALQAVPQDAAVQKFARQLQVSSS